MEDRRENYRTVFEALEEQENTRIKAGEYENLFYPLRKAVKRVGLKLTSGQILSKNNLRGSRILFFPKSVTLYRFENSEPVAIWNDVLLVHAEYKRESSGAYKIKRLKEVDEASSGELCLELMGMMRGDIAASTEENNKKVKPPIPAEAILKLIDEYALELLNLGIYADNNREALSTTKFLGAGKALRNFTQFDAYKSLFEKDFDDTLNRGIKAFMYTEIESLLFASTLFSLCKPLFRQFKIKNADPQFALQIDLRGCCTPSGSGDDSYVLSGDDSRITKQEEIDKTYNYYWALNGFVHLWCDFDIAKGRRSSKQQETDPVISDMKPFRGFRRSWCAIPRSAPWMHLYFPLVYSNYHKSQWDNEIILYTDLFQQKRKKLHPGKAWVKDIGQISCLPILLFLVPPKKAYPKADCLSIEWEFPSHTDFGQIERRMPNLYDQGHQNHEHIKSIYYKFLQLLYGKTHKEVRKSLKMSYKEALQTIGASLKNPTSDHQHKACILGSLYFARNTFHAAGIEDRDTQFERHIKQVEKIFERQQATAADFAGFLVDAHREDSPYHKAILLWDKKGIYLEWGNYWGDFKSYCKKHNITLDCTELQFRKCYLIEEGYLRPQYQVANQKKYPRYDYRKKIEGEEKTVLNVKPKILKLLK